MRKGGLVAAAVGLSAVAGATIIGTTRRFVIRERSMVPALNEGDWVIARRRTGDLRRGEIIVFTARPPSAEMTLVKRVIGLAGETIGIERGHVTIDGALLADRWADGVTSPEGTWVVPDGHVWVLGDNRSESSSDSRTVGPVPIADIPWRIAARYWPVSDIGLVG